ncbi:MAG TPA: hypothetical protein VFP80_03970 [Thermoanaerobaculia bacterium]|nr:hypothetical protein [Thermoanaerobaculia bacterium]
MGANDFHYILCRNGVFILPERFCQALGALIPNGFVYLRQDDEVLTISTTRIEGGHRRLLSGRFRAPMFREAKKLAIVNYNDSLRVMAVS